MMLVSRLCQGPLGGRRETSTDDRNNRWHQQSLSYNENSLVISAKLPTFMPEDPKNCLTPTEVSAGPPEESQSEQGHIPSSDQRAIDLMQLALLPPTRSFVLPSKTFL